MIFHTSDFHCFHENVIEFDGRPDKDVHAMNARIINTTNEFVGEKDWLVYHGDAILNKKIDHDDIVAYCECVRNVFDQLRCKNIIYVGGNHDRIYLRRHGEYRPNWLFWNMFRVWECTRCDTVFDSQRRFGLPANCKKGCEWAGDDHVPIYNVHPMGHELRLTRKICAEHGIPAEFDGTIVVCTHYSHRVWNKSHHSKEGAEIGKSINLYGHSHGGLPGIKNSFDVGFNVWNRPLPLLEILTDLMPKHNKSEAGMTYFGHHNDERKW